MSNERYDNPKKELKQTAMRLLYVTQSRYEEDWHSTPHTHPFTELFYVTGGVGNFLANKQRFPVKTNDIVIVNPMVEHTEESLENNPLEYIAIGISGITFDHQEQSELAYYSFLDQQKEVLYYLETLVQEMTLQKENYQEISQKILEILILTLPRQSKIRIKESKGDKKSKECAHIKRFIDTHYASNLTLDSLAREAHLNKFYLSHTFKRDYGLAPIDYLIEKRLSESKYFLEKTDYSISQIAGLVGYSSQSYFSQTFRKEMGVSPSRYRKQNKTKNTVG